MPMHKTIEYYARILKMILALDPAFRRGTTIIYEIEILPLESQQTGKPQMVSREHLLGFLRPDVDALVQSDYCVDFLIREENGMAHVDGDGHSIGGTVISWGSHLHRIYFEALLVYVRMPSIWYTTWIA
jgi:hypothetical protein